MKKKYKSMKKFFVVIGLIALSSLLWAYDRPLVNSLDAITGAGTTINLMWNLPENLSRPLTKLLVYRDTQPLSTFEQTKKMTPVAELSPSKTAWQDSVSDFNDYYYAVVCVTDKPYDIIMPSINATVRGVHLTGTRISKDQVIKREEKKYPAGTLRETPLPYLDILDEKKNTELSISKKVSNEARQLGISVNRRPDPLVPYVFENDLISPEAGDDYLLFDILSRTFIRKRYVEGISELRRLIGTNVSEEVLSRAQFYLGECQYFATDYESAVRSFVRVQNVYPDLTAKWIGSSLDFITIGK